jgi:hypothetical protein
MGVYMDAKDVIKHFRTVTTVPVEVDEVVEFLRASGVKDELYLWEVDINSERLRGSLVQWEPWEYPMNGEVHYVGDIYVAKSLPPDWRRLVVCKELLHVIDPVDCRVNSEADIEQLIEKLVLPPELQDAKQDGWKVLTDKVAIYEAIAVLFPLAARALMLELLKSGKTTVGEIAHIVDLPERFVRLVMWEKWPNVHSNLVGEPDAEEAA